MLKYCISRIQEGHRAAVSSAAVASPISSPYNAETSTDIWDPIYCALAAGRLKGDGLDVHLVWAPWTRPACQWQTLCLAVRVSLQFVCSGVGGLPT